MGSDLRLRSRQFSSFLGRSRRDVPGMCPDHDGGDKTLSSRDPCVEARVAQVAVRDGLLTTASRAACLAGKGTRIGYAPGSLVREPAMSSLYYRHGHGR